MHTTSLTTTATEQLDAARAASSGRAARTIFGGHEHSLRQTLIALVADSELAEHESPGEATLQVVLGRVRLAAGEDGVDLGTGDHATIPDARHSLLALEDAVVLLTVSKRDVPAG